VQLLAKALDNAIDLIISHCWLPAYLMFAEPQILDVFGL
jgi:hypothetical protein